MKTLTKLTTIGFVLLLIIGFCVGTSFFQVIDPGTRGISVTLGKVDNTVYQEGFTFKSPLATIIPMSIKQEGFKTNATCASADLQNITIETNILFRYPESQLVDLYKNYSTRVGDVVLLPKLSESLKEVTASATAEQVVKERQRIKQETLEKLRIKLNGLIIVDDVIITNIVLSKELERAIEQKMVQEQEAAKAKFKLQQAEIDAKTVVVKAEGDAKAIKIRSDALKDGHGAIELIIAEKWDGKAPLVVGGEGKGANILLPLSK